MVPFLKKQWFLIWLVVLISSGLILGSRIDESQFQSLTYYIRPRVVTAIVLFLMSFSLDSRHLKASFQAPKPVLWASLVNYAFIPLSAWALMSIQQSPDFAIGLMIAASVPCTMAAASVWTRKAGGNDAVSLLVTVLTNGVCFLVTPFWLNMATVGGARLSAGAMIGRLVVAVLVPALIGQIVRQFPRPAQFAVRYKTPIGVLAQSCILAIVFSAALNAGTRLNTPGGGTGIGGVLLVWASVIVLHLVAMALGYFGARKFGFSLADQAAVAFASSQKTLPIGVLLATDSTMFGAADLLGEGLGVPFAVFPMLMYHASQLFIDTAVAGRLAARPGKESVNDGG